MWRTGSRDRKKVLNKFWFRGGRNTKYFPGEDRDTKEKKGENNVEGEGEWKEGAEE